MQRARAPVRELDRKCQKPSGRAGGQRARASDPKIDTDMTLTGEAAATATAALAHF